MSGASAIAPATRVDHELAERRRLLRRFVFLCLLGWTAFAASDLFASLVVAHGRHLFWLLGLRLAGSLVCGGVYLLVKSPTASVWLLDAIEIFLFTSGGVMVSVMAIPFGGIASPLLQGVTVVAMVRALLPSEGSRTLAIGGTVALSFPLVMGVGAFFLPALAAQWHDRESVVAFVNNYIFVVLATGIGAYAANIQWRVRRELYEARRLGQYRLKAPIARGDVGDLWLARQESLGRDVALKVLHVGAQSDETVARFQREAKAASLLVHPNTIRIFDFGASDDGVLFIAMELLGGLDVSAMVGLTGPMSAARAIYLGKQACASLAEAHERGLVHRDIRPDNLFVTQVGDDLDFVKVLDFGVARIAARDSAGQRVDGAPGFVAPEQIVGASPDPRGDVYSLGAVLYFMVTGKAPFGGMMGHLETAPISPSSRLGKHVPYDFEQTVLRCLAKRPPDRYPSVRELGAALEACADDARWTKDDARQYWASLAPSVHLVSLS
jgi:eukaryotic-like serine/threonine-protein kinase